MHTTLFFEALGIEIDISSSPSTPSSPPSANYTPVLTDPRLGMNCSRVITVSCLQQLYNATGYKPAATDKNKIGITGYLGQFANNADLQSFYEAERPDALNSTFQTVLVSSAYTQRWASCLYILGSRSDACCLCGGAY
jgi:tripeptidyl-peptidase-1